MAGRYSSTHFTVLFLWNILLSFFLGGLTRGSIYALIALGYTMVYGIVQLINFAHGEIYMIGAFTALIVVSVLTMLGWNQVAILLIAAGAAVDLFVGLRLYHGEDRLQTLAPGPPAVCPDQRHRHVVVSAELCTPGPDLGFPSFSRPDSLTLNSWNRYAHIIGSPEAGHCAYHHGCHGPA